MEAENIATLLVGHMNQEMLKAPSTLVCAQVEGWDCFADNVVVLALRQDLCARNLSVAMFKVAGIKINTSKSWFLSTK